MIRTAIYKKLQSLKVALTKKSRLAKLNQMSGNGFPPQMVSAVRFLINGELDAAAKKVATFAEQQRQLIAAQGDTPVEIWYSPKPGSVTDLESRPQPGKVLNYTMGKVAFTGKNRKWATALHLISREFQSTSGIELGTCVGISAIYLASHEKMQQFITVEGSVSLAATARKSLQDLPHVSVVNQLFDEAIDTQVVQTGALLDLAYIDGHHEKIATIHYFERLRPFLKAGGVVLFDDISWSADMREAWDLIKVSAAFSHAIDLGAVGVCILKASTEPSDTIPHYWDLQPLVGKFPIGQPHGWKG
jgi:predicted O-methyltransferase YrrM